MLFSLFVLWDILKLHLQVKWVHVVTMFHTDFDALKTARLTYFSLGYGLWQ